MIPRRNRLDLLTPIEKEIFDIIGKIELMPADASLTDAQQYLDKAKNKLSDYIDEQLTNIFLHYYEAQVD